MLHVQISPEAGARPILTLLCQFWVHQFYAPKLRKNLITENVHRAIASGTTGLERVFRGLIATPFPSIKDEK